MFIQKIKYLKGSTTEHEPLGQEVLHWDPNEVEPTPPPNESVSYWADMQWQCEGTEEFWGGFWSMPFHCQQNVLQSGSGFLGDLLREEENPSRIGHNGLEQSQVPAGSAVTGDGKEATGEKILTAMLDSTSKPKDKDGDGIIDFEQEVDENGNVSFGESAGVGVNIFNDSIPGFIDASQSSPNPKGGFQRNACRRMAKRLENYIDAEIKSLGGENKITTHKQIDSIVNNSSKNFLKHYTGYDYLKNYGSIAYAQDGGAEGFKKEYLDEKDPKDDQTHHFAPFFYTGVTNSWTKATAQQMFDDNDNDGDWLLGDVGYSMGNSLRKKTKTISEVKTTVKKIYTSRGIISVPKRTTVYKSIDEPVATRLSRVKGIANRIKNEICE